MPSGATLLIVGQWTAATATSACHPWLLLGVVQKDSAIETSMARAEALRGLSNLAQHGLRCKTVEGQLERYKAFEIIRTAVVQQ